MPRQRTGTLVPRRNGYAAKLTVIEDGVSVRREFPIRTTSKAVARAKLRQLVAEHSGDATGAKEAAAKAETFEEAARRVIGAMTIKTARDRLRLLERQAFPSLGHFEVGAVRAAHVRECLEAFAATGASQSTVKQLRMAIGTVLGALWRDEQIPENPVARVRTPKAHRDNRERAVLTDEELARYLAWEHPSPKLRKGVLERQTMACVARMFGGLRTGDLHALRWETLDSADGAFTWGTAPRCKTARPQRLVIPEMLRPILRDWWERKGRPSEGFVFPNLRSGKRARAGSTGREGSGLSHAEAFRTDLRRAFGIDKLTEERVEVPDRRCAAGKRPVVKRRWKQARELTARERELLTATEHTRPVDFHSWRRAFVQALADAGLNAQQAATLAGHANLSAHERYLRTTKAAATIPLAALPRLGIRRSGRRLPEASPVFFEPPSRLELETYGLRIAILEQPHISRTQRLCQQVP